MKTLLSLYDYSGIWSEPFACNGWNVIQWDIKIADFMDINLIEDADIALEEFEDVDGIIAAPPCTDFTNSGSQYWPQKDLDGRTQQSLEYVYQVQRLVNLFRPTDPDYDGTFFWALENPIGRLNKLIPELGQPYYFEPYEFARWNKLTKKEILRLDNIRLKNGTDVTDEEAELITQTNAYTKRTCLWGEFNRNLIKKPIEPVKACKQGTITQRFGGKSISTKEARSNTPLGFAMAFYEANKNYAFTDHQQLTLY